MTTATETQNRTQMEILTVLDAMGFDGLPENPLSQYRLPYGQAVMIQGPKRSPYGAKESFTVTIGNSNPMLTKSRSLSARGFIYRQMTFVYGEFDQERFEKKVDEVLAVARTIHEAADDQARATVARRDADAAAAQDLGWSMSDKGDVTLSSSMRTVETNYRVRVSSQVFDTVAEAAIFAREIAKVVAQFGGRSE